MPLNLSNSPPTRGNRHEFIPGSLPPLSLRHALRFAKHMASGIAFLGGIFAFLALLLGGFAVVLMLIEDLPLSDAIYLVLITALTIGYGDITPQTLVGSVVCVLTGLTGILFTGMVIAVAVRALDFTIHEAFERQAGGANASTQGDGDRESPTSR